MAIIILIIWLVTKSCAVETTTWYFLMYSRTQVPAKEWYHTSFLRIQTKRTRSFDFRPKYCNYRKTLPGTPYATTTLQMRAHACVLSYH